MTLALQLCQHQLHVRPSESSGVKVGFGAKKQSQERPQEQRAAVKGQLVRVMIRL